MAWYNRSRPRGVRPELPAAAPGSNSFAQSGQWGEIALPLPSTSTVLGLPAANRAKYLISNAVAQMAPMQMWGPDGFISEDPPNIITRPNSVYTCFDFFQMATELAIMRGNFVGIQADFDVKGYAQQIVPVSAGFWTAYYDGAGYLVYAINGLPYSRDEVVHIRANAAPNQPMGVGVVTQFRRSLGLALDQQNYAADTFRSGAVPAGIIELDLPEVDKPQADFVQGQWLTNHAGGRAPAVLPNTMKFTPLSWSPEDIEFLASREFTVGEIAHMFNLDPTDLGAAMAGASMTYANIEQRQQQRITDTYAPWMLRFEQEWSDLLPGGNTAKLVPDNLLRTDSKTRAEVQQLEIGNEVLTVAEARKIQGKRPLPAPKVACATCGQQVSEPKLPAHMAAHAAVTPVAPGAPASTADGGELTAATAQPDPDDPNISQTPIKVKI